MLSVLGTDFPQFPETAAAARQVNGITTKALSQWTLADPHTLRMDCQLWSKGQKTELTLIADYREQQRQAALTFRLLETQ